MGAVKKYTLHYLSLTFLAGTCLCKDSHALLPYHYPPQTGQNSPQLVSPDDLQYATQEVLALPTYAGNPKSASATLSSMKADAAELNRSCAGVMTPPLMGGTYDVRTSSNSNEPQLLASMIWSFENSLISCVKNKINWEYKYGLIVAATQTALLSRLAALLSDMKTEYGNFPSPSSSCTKFEKSNCGRCALTGFSYPVIFHLIGSSQLDSETITLSRNYIEISGEGASYFIQSSSKSGQLISTDPKTAFPISKTCVVLKISEDETVN